MFGLQKKLEAWFQWSSALGIFLILQSCTTQQVTSTQQSDGPPQIFDINQVADVTPRREPLSRYGNPSSYEQFGETYHVLKSGENFKQQGIASWYGSKFHGRRTSSGETYSLYKMTAAHKTLPLPSYVKVTNLDNHRTVVVKVNDRGPFRKQRIIDLSYAAAVKLGYAEKGTAPVHIEVIAAPITDTSSSKVFQKNNMAVNSNLWREDLQGKQEAAGEYFVQLAALSDRTRAQSLAASMAADLNWQVFIMPIRGNNGQQTLYRVRIGPIDNKIEAQSLTDQLIQEGDLGQPHIIFKKI